MNKDINVRRVYLVRSVSLSNLQANHIQPLLMDKCQDLLTLKVGDRLVLLKPWQKIFLEYPVTVAMVDKETDRLIVVVSYIFGFYEALRMITLGGSVRRKYWHWSVDVKHIKTGPKDKRGFLWRNTGDGYLPWLPSGDDCKADDWGVRYGYRTNEY